MDKRAVEMSMQTIVIAALSLIVLVIIILIFRGQIGGISLKYFGIGEEAAASANATNRCQSLLGDRVCVSGAACPATQVVGGKSVGYIQLPTPAGGNWSDCGPGNVCCERLS